ATLDVIPSAPLPRPEQFGVACEGLTRRASRPTEAARDPRPRVDGTLTDSWPNVGFRRPTVVPTTPLARRGAASASAAVPTVRGCRRDRHGNRRASPAPPRSARRDQ